MEWVRKMNGISNRAIEHIKTKILYPAFDNYSLDKNRVLE